MEGLLFLGKQLRRLVSLILFGVLIYMACVRIHDWWYGYGDLF